MKTPQYADGLDHVFDDDLGDLLGHLPLVLLEVVSEIALAQLHYDVPSDFLNLIIDVLDDVLVFYLFELVKLVVEVFPAGHASRKLELLNSNVFP